MKRLILAFSVLALAVSLAAQGGDWTLKQCIDYALDHNINIKRQELTTEMARKDLVQSKLSALPDLNGVLEHQLGSGRVLDRGTYEWYNTSVSQGDLGVQSTLTLFDGLQGVFAIQRDRATYQMNQADLDASRDDVMLEVMTGYLDLLLSIELEQIAKKKLDVVGLQVERMQRMVDLGTQSPGELLTLKSQYSNENLNLTKARNTVRTSRLLLQLTMNLPQTDTFAIQHPDLRAPEEYLIPGLDSIFSIALSEQPKIKSAKFYEESMKKNLAVQQGKLFPTVYVRGLYYTNYSNKLTNPLDNTYDYPLPQQLIDNQYRQLTVGLSVPIFNKWQTQTSISKARISYQDAAYYLESQRQVLVGNIQQYYTEALSSRDDYIASVELVASSGEAFKYAEERFRVGMANAVELEEARNKLFEAQSQMVTARYFYIFYCKILDFYQGMPIEL